MSEPLVNTEGHARDVDLIFEGGGLKGIALAGAYSVLEERGYRPQNVAGASAGAIVAALVAAGYTAAELRETIMEFDFNSLKDRAWEDLLPVLSRTVSVLKDRGIYEGETFLEWMTGLLETKGVRTFGDLVRRPEAELRYRYKLQVIASDLTEQRLLVLPRDAHRLGIEDPDELSVAMAVRMSMSIPMFFEPVSFTNPKTGREHLLVDGGMLSNFPVWLFDAEEPLWPTIGLKFIEEDPRAPLATLGSHGGLLKVVDYARSLVETMMEAHDRFYIEETDFDRTIAIDALGVGTTEFDLPRERAMKLYDSGRAAAEKFLSRKQAVPEAQVR
ncbi:MAG: patatin-like phospholipase family protein [Actinomycetota bacterium]|nr:patatin-like phospholipase family protein [Actinomycetota bacterium]